MERHHGRTGVNMDLNFWKGKRVLITGNSGFKGSWLCMILSRLGATIIGYSIPQPVSKPCLYELAKVKDLLAKVYLDDIRLEYMVQVAVCESNPEIVFHMAAQTIVKDGFRDPLGTFETNVLGTANLLQACKMADNVRSTVIITTDKVYDLQAGPWGYREIDPLGAADPYSTSKACSELVAKCYATYEMGDMPIVTARAGNVIGGGDFSYRLMPMLVRWLNNGTVPVIWDPTAVRPWQ
jgi:CDP-glucose 4,6-dehydratase